MLMRLRWKFTLVLMLILSGALGAALAVQTASTLRQYRAGTDQALQSVLQRSQAALDPWGVPFGGGGFDRDEGLAPVPSWPPRLLRRQKSTPEACL